MGTPPILAPAPGAPADLPRRGAAPRPGARPSANGSAGGVRADIVSGFVVFLLVIALGAVTELKHVREIGKDQFASSW